MSFTVKTLFVTEVGKLYFRNNKSGSAKRLRCFPACTEGRHRRSGFCGGSVSLLLRVKHGIPDPSSIQAFGELGLYDDRPSATSGVAGGIGGDPNDPPALAITPVAAALGVSVFMLRGAWRNRAGIAAAVTAGEPEPVGELEPVGGVNVVTAAVVQARLAGNAPAGGFPTYQ